jgi:hypothetical protein
MQAYGITANERGQVVRKVNVLLMNGLLCKYNLSFPEKSGNAHKINF